MSSTTISYTANGSTLDYAIPFEYLKKTFIKVYVNGVLKRGGPLSDPSSDYYFIDKTTIKFRVAPQNGYIIVILRQTSATERVVSFSDGSILNAKDLTVSQVQSIHIAEEARDLTENTVRLDLFTNSFDAKNKKISNVGDPQSPKDASNKDYVDKVLEANIGTITQLTNKAEQCKNQSCECASKAKASEVASKASEVASLASQNASKASEAKAKASEEASMQSEMNASASEASAEASAVRAKESETLAEGHKKASATSAGNAKTSELNARDYAAEATRQTTEATRQANIATNAKELAEVAKNSASNSAISAGNSAQEAKDAAARIDSTAFVQTVPQTLTPEKQAQACKNISCLPLSGGTVSGNIISLDEILSDYQSPNGDEGGQFGLGAPKNYPNSAFKIDSFRNQFRVFANNGNVMLKLLEDTNIGYLFGKEIERVDSSGDVWIRFESGWQVCFSWTELTSERNKATHISNSYPKPFFAIPLVIPVYWGGWAYSVGIGIEGTTTTNWNGTCQRKEGEQSVSCKVGYLAFGRWK